MDDDATPGLPDDGGNPELPTPAEAQASIPCRHLRSKGMYVYGDMSMDAESDFDNTIYWCLRTMKEFGPDDDQVTGRDCRDPARSCYEPL